MKIKELEFKIKLFANKIQAPNNLLPEINESNDFAKPYIDIGIGETIYYVIRERGIEHERTIYRNEDELLFRIFKDITFIMAAEYELKNRIENQDSRILLFKKQEELLIKLDPNWAIITHSEHNKYLKM